MTPITSELRKAIEQAGNEPVEIFDPETNTIDLLVREHDSLLLPIDWSGEFTGEEMMQLMWDVMKDDWSHPSMDVYDTEAYA